MFLFALISSPDLLMAKDWEVYTGVGFEKKVNEKAKFKLEKEWRFYKGEQYFQQTDIGFSISDLKHFEWGGGYRQGFVTHKNKEKRADTPYLYGTHKWDAGIFKASARLMYEQRYFSTGAQNGRVRARLQFQYPFKKIGLTPYIADEAYLHLGGDYGSHLNANTFTLGLKQRIFKSGEIDLAYKKQDIDTRSKHGEFKNEFDVVSLKIRFEL
jgi:hypothetical protein